MRITTIIDYFREVPLDLTYVEGKVEYPKSKKFVDRRAEGSRWVKPVVELVCSQSLDEVYDRLMKNAYFNWRFERRKGEISFDSMKISSPNGYLHLNIRIVRISLKTCALVGYISRYKKVK